MHVCPEACRRPSGVRQLAAAFLPRACSRPSGTNTALVAVTPQGGVSTMDADLKVGATKVPLHGQQAGQSESGSKLPHSRKIVSGDEAELHDKACAPVCVQRADALHCAANLLRPPLHDGQAEARPSRSRSKE